MQFIKKYEIQLIFSTALLTYFIQGIAWPFTLGRDGMGYLLYYLEILSKQPVYNIIMLMRTPIAPLLYGSLLSIGGSIFAEIILGLIYSGAIIGVYFIGRIWSKKIGVIAALLVNAFPAYGAIYHTISSEAPLAFLFIIWSLYFLIILQMPSVKCFIGLGILAFVLILARPTMIALILFAVIPFLLFIKPLRIKVIYSLSFIGTFIPLVLLWCTYNYIRYDDFTIARTNNAHLPLYRVFIITHTVKPENGIASAKLAADVEKYLLDKEPYCSYGITKEIFFSKSTSRMWGDLKGISDEYYGWDTDYRFLQRVGFEAVFRYPKEYLFSVIRSFGGILLKTYTQPQSTRAMDKEPQPLNSNGLPIPSEGDAIPRSYYMAGSSSSTGIYKTDPNSVELKLVNPDMQKKLDELNTWKRYYESILPSRNGIEVAANIFNTISICFLPPLLWIICGVIGLVLHPDAQNIALAFICLVCMLVLFYTVLAVPSYPAMRVPFEPLLMIFGIIGIKEIISKIKKRKGSVLTTGFHEF